MFKVGQEVWFEPSDPRDKGFNCTIEKVGHLYYTVEKYGWHGKFDKETNYRGEYPHGHLWESEQAAKDNRQADKMFKALFHKFRNINPTLEQMIKVYEVLGLDKEDI